MLNSTWIDQNVLQITLLILPYSQRLVPPVLFIRLHVRRVNFWRHTWGMDAGGLFVIFPPRFVPFLEDWVVGSLLSILGISCLASAIGLTSLQYHVIKLIKIRESWVIWSCNNSNSTENFWHFCLGQRYFSPLLWAQILTKVQNWVKKVGLVHLMSWLYKATDYFSFTLTGENITEQKT